MMITKELLVESNTCTSMLGLAGIRSFDKKNGVASK